MCQVTAGGSIFLLILLKKSVFLLKPSHLIKHLEVTFYDNCEVNRQVRIQAQRIGYPCVKFKHFDKSKDLSLAVSINVGLISSEKVIPYYGFSMVASEIEN